jgi:hypothetical protein
MEYPVTDICAYLISPTLSSCCGHYILHGFTALIIFGEEQKLWKSSAYNFLQPHVASNILLVLCDGNKINVVIYDPEIWYIGWVRALPYFGLLVVGVWYMKWKQALRLLAVVHRVISRGLWNDFRWRSIIAIVNSILISHPFCMVSSMTADLILRLFCFKSCVIMCDIWIYDELSYVVIYILQCSKLNYVIDSFKWRIWSGRITNSVFIAVAFVLDLFPSV